MISVTSPFNLEEITQKIDALRDKLSRAQLKYLQKRYAKEHYRSALISSAPGKSYAEKEMNAQSTPSWLEFHMELAHAETVYDHYLREYDSLKMRHQDAYLKEKIDSDFIKSQK